MMLWTMHGCHLAIFNSRSFYVGGIIVSLAVVSGLSTFLILTGLTPIVPRSSVVWVVLLVNVALIIAMLALITSHVSGLWQAWRNKVAGSRLHVRIVILFSLIAALPALLLAFAATTTFSRSLDGWFSTRTRLIVNNSLDVANAYLEEHGQVIRSDIVNMAKDVENAASTIGNDKEQLKNLLFVQAGLRELPFAYIVNGKGERTVSALQDKAFPFRPPPKYVIDLTRKGQVELLMPRDSYHVAALKKLDAYPDAFLFVARPVSPKVLGHLRRTQAGVAEYHKLRKRRGGLHAAHALMYFMISLTAMLAAIWVGLWFAGRFVAPIRRLIGAAQLVSRGNLNVALPERRGEGDLRRLSQTFNTMTTELRTQRDELVSTNDQLRERRSFMEATLAGVSAGVLGLDRKLNITLANRSAVRLLRTTDDALIGRALATAIPEFVEVVESYETSEGANRPPHQVVMILDDEEHTFAVRLTRETSSDDSRAVLTFDDITQLVSAQRASAWADVARRIAHEIKNPLTPIQLSAERIRRKYGQAIGDDREVFDQCTDTIIRRVGDVSRMVDEFSSFARMPKPELELDDVREPVRETVTLYQMGGDGIRFTIEMPDRPVTLMLDRRLLAQALTNLVKNGAEAVQAVQESEGKPADFVGRVHTRVIADDHKVVIDVIDNGVGLSKQLRTRLLEPYVTTKAKGTGLGLAIVQKIVEQHGGTLELTDAPVDEGFTRGAMVRITMPRESATEVDEHGHAAKVPA